MGPSQGAEGLCFSITLLQVVPNTRLKHILSLWQVLAARRSMLLVQMNQVREMRLGLEGVCSPGRRKEPCDAAAI